APRADSYPSDILTADAREKASRDVDLVYDYSTEKATQIAQAQLAAFDREVRTIDRAFEDATKPDERATLLESAMPGLSEGRRSRRSWSSTPRTRRSSVTAKRSPRSRSRRSTTSG